MNKKDRIAVVISIPFLVIIGAGVLTGATPSNAEMLIIVLPISIYWGYRFIAGDISFLSKNLQD